MDYSVAFEAGETAQWWRALEARGLGDSWAAGKHNHRLGSRF